MNLNPIFCDHMVLQAGQSVRIFGEGQGTVTVQLDGMTGTVVSEGDRWLLELPSHPYGGPFTLNLDLNGTQKTLQDVYFGDVILVAGQSNVQLTLEETNFPREDYETSPLLRLFALARLEEGEYFKPEHGWVLAESDTVAYWSGLGYLCGNLLSKATGHAVGIIACYQGASMIQSWLPADALVGTECDICTEQQTGHLRIPDYMAWNHDGQLYREMFQKMTPFAVKAVLWYQGEANTRQVSSADHYGDMLTRLIHAWRKELMLPELDFIVVQLADWFSEWCEIEGWKKVQKAQMEAVSSIEHAYCVPCADICENDNIHPPTKLPLAQRITALLQKL